MNANTSTFRDIRNAAQRAARANQHFADTLTQFLDSGAAEMFDSAVAEQKRTQHNPFQQAAPPTPPGPTGPPAKKPDAVEPAKEPAAHKGSPAKDVPHKDIDLAAELVDPQSAEYKNRGAQDGQPQKGRPQHAAARQGAPSRPQQPAHPQSPQQAVPAQTPQAQQPTPQPTAAQTNEHGRPTQSLNDNVNPPQSLLDRMIGSSSTADSKSSAWKDNKLVAWWQREETVTKILAVLGGVITIIGLVFLAMLAYKSGILGPQSSVILAAVICVIVFASAFKARKNNPDGVLGPALIVVATLGGLVDVWVAVFKLEWYSPVLGSIITTMLVIVGLLVAYTWNHEKLGIIITAFSPLFILPVAINIINADYFTPAFSGCILATALAAFAVRWGNEWGALHMTASFVFILGVLLTWDRPILTLLAGAVGVALLMIFSYEQPIVSRELEVLSWIAFLLVPTFMCINQGSFHYIFSGAVFAAMLAWVIANGGYARFQIGQRQAKDNANVGFYVALGALSMSMLWEYAEHGHAVFGFVFMLLAIGVVYLIPRTEPKAGIVAIIIGLLVVVSDTAMAWRGEGKGPGGAMTLDSVIFIVLGAVLAAGMVIKRKELAQEQPELQMDDKAQLAVFLVALFQISAIVPAVALFISDTELSYMVAQLIISVTWMFLGIKLLNNQGETFRKAGLALTLLATAKLVFFDLSVLGGLVQVIAFIVSGVILLVAAFNREKILKEPTQAAQPQGATPQAPQQQPQQPGATPAGQQQRNAPQQNPNPYGSPRG